MEQVIANLIQDFERGKITRRQLIQTLALATTAASAVGLAPAASAAGNGLKTTGIHHISYQVADYAKTRDFYADLIGMKVTDDDAKRKQCHLSFGDESYPYFVVRTQPANVPSAGIDHIRFIIDNYDEATTTAELKRRGLLPKKGERVKDPDGLGVDLEGKDCPPGLKVCAD